MSDLADSMLEKVISNQVERRRPVCEQVIEATYQYLDEHYPNLDVPQVLLNAFAYPNPKREDLIFVAEVILSCERQAYSRREQQAVEKWLKRQARQ